MRNSVSKVMALVISATASAVQSDVPFLLICKSTSECFQEEGNYGCYDEVVGTISHLYVSKDDSQAVLFVQGDAIEFSDLSGTGIPMSEHFGSINFLRIEDDLSAYNLAFLSLHEDYFGSSIATCEKVE